MTIYIKKSFSIILPFFSVKNLQRDILVERIVVTFCTIFNLIYCTVFQCIFRYMSFLSRNAIASEGRDCSLSFLPTSVDFPLPLKILNIKERYFCISDGKQMNPSLDLVTLIFKHP